jgi:hypothetical protein
MRLVPYPHVLVRARLRDGRRRGGSSQDIEEATQFERLCTTPKERADLKAHWENGLRGFPNHAPTRAAVEMLEDDETLGRLYLEVKAARETSIQLTAGV